MMRLIRWIGACGLLVTAFMGAAFASAEGPLSVGTGMHPFYHKAKIIDRLDSKSLKPGRYRFYFRAGYRNTGDPILVPVVVVKGVKPGKRLMLTSAIHGDELNGIRAIHKLLPKLDISTLRGTVIAVPGMNRPGIENNSRYYIASGAGGTQTNLNRVMPGKEFGSTGERYAFTLWQKLLSDNADLAIDLHTQTRGTAYPLYVFADFRLPEVKKMAYKLGPDIIKDDPGLVGTLETTYIRHKIPAVTFEIGSPKKFQENLVDRAVNGILRVMASYKMIDTDSNNRVTVMPYIGRKTTDIEAHKGGILVLKVKLMQAVKKGQYVGCLYDNFGIKQKCYTAPHAGRVLAVSTDPMREAGSLIVRLIK